MKKRIHKFPYNWTLKDTKFTKDKGKVFSCFACGGGSTMGYKLAGYDVLGCNEIDPKMMKAYKVNFKPKFSYLESIQTFKLRNDLPDELYELDILDGSPPCSSFSMVGNREKDWGKEKKFREGQTKQILDTLFFDFIDFAKELQPKVVIAENVKGLLLGNAKKYVKQIYKEFDSAGYYVQHKLLNVSKMGVCQNRSRVFFICLRKDLAKPFLKQINLFAKIPNIDLNFNEKRIPFSEIFTDYTDRPLRKKMKEVWEKRKIGDMGFDSIMERDFNKRNLYFGHRFIYMTRPGGTILGSDQCVLFDYPRYRNFHELCSSGSFPIDYNFNENKPEYIIGMSVPPIMVAQIAEQIYNQWLSKLK